MRENDIIQLAQGLRCEMRTWNPLIIAKYLGIRVLFRPDIINGFKAQTIKMPGYPTIISINERYSEKSRFVLCAHELGHAILHENVVNHFAVTPKNVGTNVEYEANLFAVALLCDEEDFNMPICKMSNSILKSILDYNIEVQ